MTTLTRPFQRVRHAPLREEIHVPRQGDRCGVGAADDLPLSMSPSSVREHNNKLLNTLKEVRLNTKDTLFVEPSFYESKMRELRSTGLSAFMTLGEEITTRFDSLEQKAGKLGCALTIKSDTFPLLWEMLYTGSSQGDVQVDRFWGFRHRIARFQLGATSADEEEIDSNCDFVFGHHHDLGCWQQERDDVKRVVSDRFRFRQLEEVLAEPSLAGLADDMNDRFIGALDRLDMGILHLACHCNPDPVDAGVLFSELAFSGESLVVHIKLRDLKSARRDFGFRLQPLVFLNACKTMTNPEHILQGDSFPNGFLRFGASGVIATACDVPDLFASAFAAKFYENLFIQVGGRSPTVSEALLKTRLFFVSPPYYNPLGLAYGLYARNDLHIEWDPWGSSEEGGDHADR